MIAKTRNAVFPLQIAAICTLFALIMWHPGGNILKEEFNPLVYLNSNLSAIGDMFREAAASVKADQVVPIPVPTVQPEPTARPAAKYRLKVFDRQAFNAANVGPDAVDLSACILVKYLRVTNDASFLCVRDTVPTFQPKFKICTYPSAKDRYVSGMIRSGKGWETHISTLLLKMLQKYGKDAIFVDAGTNIGAHALYIAKSNLFVYGVEPQPINLNRVS